MFLQAKRLVVVYDVDTLHYKVSHAPALSAAAAAYGSRLLAHMSRACFAASCRWFGPETRTPYRLRPCFCPAIATILLSPVAVALAVAVAVVVAVAVAVAAPSEVAAAAAAKSLTSNKLAR